MSTDLRKWINSIPSNRTVKALQAALDLAIPTKVDNGLTAHAGGTQAAALALNRDASFHNVTTVASAADSVVLPPAKEGQFHLVKNSATTNAMQVFAPSPDTIDSVATGTGVSQLAGDAVLYFCMVDGNYLRLGGVQASEVFTAITTANITVTSTAQVANLVVTGLSTMTTAQVTNLNATGPATLTTAQVTKLNVTGLSTLTTAQIVNLDATGPATLTTAQVTKLNVTGLATMTTAQVTTLAASGGIAAFGVALTTAAHAALTTAALPTFTTAEIATFTTAQCAALNTDLALIPVMAQIFKDHGYSL